MLDPKSQAIFNFNARTSRDPADIRACHSWNGVCATLYIYTRFRFSLFGNVPSVFDPLEPGGTIVPFTIGWRCHFRTIAHDPPSVPFLFYTCMHGDQPGDTLLARVYPYNFVLFVCAACYSLISSSVHVESCSNLQPVRQRCVFF